MTTTQTSPAAKFLANPTEVSRRGTQTDSSHMSIVTQAWSAAVSPPTNESSLPAVPTAAANSDSWAGAKLDGSHGIHEDHVATAAVAERPPASAIELMASIPEPRVLVDPLLILSAQALDDLESTRIANENRLRSLRDVYGLAGSPQEAEAAGLVEGLAKLEHDAELALKRALRRHPLGPWVKRTTGVGEKQGARLISAIGDPYWNSLHDRPRTVSELWAYCGYHVLRAGGDLGHERRDVQSAHAGVAPVRARGQKANWSAEAKMRVWLVACSCIKKADSPYRAVYDEARAKYDGGLHQVDCKRCGPAGHPAVTGTPLSPGHQHARALRLVSKAILRDLWIEARAIHGADKGTAS